MIEKDLSRGSADHQVAGFGPCRLVIGVALVFGVWSGPVGNAGGLHAQDYARSGFDWRLSYSSDPRGGISRIPYISQVPDLNRSDIGFAGMTVRCGDRGFETILVVADPVPPRSISKVTLFAGGTTLSVEASPISSGAGLILPIDLESRFAGSWHNAKDLDVTIDEGGMQIKGAITIAALPSALARLDSECRAAKMDVR